MSMSFQDGLFPVNGFHDYNTGKSCPEISQTAARYLARIMWFRSKVSQQKQVPCSDHKPPLQLIFGVGSRLPTVRMLVFLCNFALVEYNVLQEPTDLQGKPVENGSYGRLRFPPRRRRHEGNLQENFTSIQRSEILRNNFKIFLDIFYTHFHYSLKPILLVSIGKKVKT